MSQQQQLLLDRLEQGAQQLAFTGRSASSRWPDGKVRIGENFLLPVENAYFDKDKVGGVLRIAKTAPPGLNDILSQAANTSDANNMVNDSLAKRDSVDISLWRGVLAKSVKVNEGFTAIEFELRKGIYWQDSRIAQEGFEWLQQREELDAEDFAFYIDLV